jgi:Uma2 family endonuclease
MRGVCPISHGTFREIRAGGGGILIVMALRQPMPARSTVTRSSLHGKKMSVRQFRALAEEKPYLELIDGVVEQKPMVSANHGRLIGRLDMRLGIYAEANGGDFGPERNVAVDPENEFLPDTAYWAAGVESGDYSIPTVAVEVRSPNQSMAKLRDKCRRYLGAGTSAAWLFDPKGRTVEVFEAQGVRTLRPGDTLTCEAMPGFELPLAELFGALDR